MRRSDGIIKLLAIPVHQLTKYILYYTNPLKFLYEFKLAKPCVNCLQEDTGYWIWSFQGKLLQRQRMDRFCLCLWRPRPPTLLSKEQMKEIKKNLKKYAAQFDLKDKMTLSKASKVYQPKHLAASFSVKIF